MSFLELNDVTVEEVGVWLIGIGALVIAAALVLASERPYTGMTFRGPFNTRRDRTQFALEGTGALFVAGGSVLLAATEPPSLWLFLALPAGYAIFHGLAAWKLWQYWRYRAAEADRAALLESSTELERRFALCARECATWRWCLGHPFNQEYWPQATMKRLTRENL